MAAIFAKSKQFITKIKLNTVNHSSSLSTYTSLYTWGRGNEGALGHPIDKKGIFNSYEELLPRKLDAFDQTTITKFDFGSAHSAAIDDKGQLYTWGQNKNHRLGLDGDITDECVEKPALVSSLSHIEIKDVSCGEFHTTAVDNKGQVYTWGWGGSLFTGQGPLGLGGMDTQPTPKVVETLVENGVKVKTVSSGELHTLALSDDGEVWGWGNGEYGRLGNLGSKSTEYPEPIEALQTMNVKQISCGHAFSMILSEDGTVFSWGRNDHGQLGLGGGITMDVYSLEDCPRLIEGLEGVKMISAGHTHAAAVTEDGKLYMWGAKTWLEPREMTVLNDYVVSSVSCGSNFTAALTSCGKLFTFGKGRSRCLGHGDTKTRQQPVQVEAFKDQIVTKIACGHHHIGALVSTRQAAADSDFSLRS